MGLNNKYYHSILYSTNMHVSSYKTVQQYIIMQHMYTVDITMYWGINASLMMQPCLFMMQYTVLLS
jgi:hypothetical protein